MIPLSNISPEIFSISNFGLTLVLRWYAVSLYLDLYALISIMKYCIKKAFLWKNDNPPITDDQADALLTYLILGCNIRKVELDMFILQSQFLSDKPNRYFSNMGWRNVLSWWFWVWSLRL